jgi:site-specific recombinase, phage integrase family
MGQLGKGRFPALGSLPVSEIKVSQVKEVIEAVAARGALETAGRILQRIKSVFTYAIRTERAKNHPAVPLVGLIKAPKKKHQPALPQSELTEFYRRLMLEQAEQQTKIAMQLIMLTFVRNGELRTAEWSEFDLDGAEWSIPVAKMKMKAPHIVPLADWTLELLVEMKELTGYSRYLFPSVKDPDKYMSENNATFSYT